MGWNWLRKTRELRAASLKVCVHIYQRAGSSVQSELGMWLKTGFAAASWALEPVMPQFEFLSWHWYFSLEIGFTVFKIIVLVP